MEKEKKESIEEVKVSVTATASSSQESQEKEETEGEVPYKRYIPSVKREPLLKIPGEQYIDPLMHKVHVAKMQAEMVKREENAQLSRLVAETGMPITQENGQRRYGPPRDFLGPPPRKGTEVFIGKLPRDAYEPELVPLFSQIGRIYEMRIMMDFTGLNRGYGFVQYYNTNDADNAITYLNNYELRPGKPIGVVKSVDNCRLYVGGIPKDKTRDQIFVEINRITEGVERVLVSSDPDDRTKHRGFAFVEYESHRAAAMARRKMLPGKIPMFGSAVTMDWAQPEPDILTLFVKNLSETTPPEKLEALFNLHSENGVLRVIKRDKHAYISFNTPMQAEQGRRTLDGSVIDGSKIIVTFARQRGGTKNFIPYQMQQFQNQSGTHQNQTRFPNYEGYSTPIPNPIQNQSFVTGYGNSSFSGPPPMLALGGFGQYQNYTTNAELPQPLSTFFAPSQYNPPPGFYFQ